MSYCLCCHSSLLRHFQNQHLYWYCPSCHQAMPAATAEVLTQSFTPIQLPIVLNDTALELCTAYA
ncbi:MAG: hypothetical protein F6J87_16565 [Spirulina sp. SIO3F2]|nr:hypothetical protein [Spirulina sp. SIO3F2]